MRLFMLPGVFRPISDTWILAEALAAEPAVRGGRVLDVCTGSGALATHAARLGAAEAHAVDVSRRAVLNARLTGLLNGVRVRAVRGDLLTAVAGRIFDVIVSNPPYVPAPTDELPSAGPGRATDGGRDGRAVLDRICTEAPGHLAPGGAVLLVHSSVCDPDATVRLLGDAGLEAEVVVRRPGPFGPLLQERAELLEARRLVAAGQRQEEVVVVRGRRPAA
jgi:release factor glutamine methyltransferase